MDGECHVCKQTSRWITWAHIYVNGKEHDWNLCMECMRSVFNLLGWREQ